MSNGYKTGRPRSVDSRGRMIGYEGGYTDEGAEEFTQRDKIKQMEGIANLIQFATTVYGGFNFLENLSKKGLKAATNMQAVVKPKGATKEVIKDVLVKKPRETFLGKLMPFDLRGKKGLMINPDLITGEVTKASFDEILNEGQKKIIEDLGLYETLFKPTK